VVPVEEQMFNDELKNSTGKGDKEEKTLEDAQGPAREVREDKAMIQLERPRDPGT
jgi:hypothetical protein